MWIDTKMLTAKEAWFPDSNPEYKILSSRFRTQEQITAFIEDNMWVEVVWTLIKNDVWICNWIWKNGEKIELFCMSHYTEWENWSWKINWVPIDNWLEDKKTINNKLRKDIIIESKGNLSSIKKALKYFWIKWFN